MDTSKFDEKINKLEKQIKSHQNNMENACKDFLEATKEFAVEWFQNEVESTIKSNPEIAKKHGIEGLHELKSDLEKLIADIPQIVEKHVNVDKCWGLSIKLPDDPSIVFGRYGIYGHPPTDDSLDSGVRAILGYVANLLVKYGFIDTKRQGQWEIKHGTDHAKLAYAYEWSDRMKVILKRYSDQYKRLIELNNELRETKKEKSEAEAKSLWDKA